jgi:hypothetical protein
MEFKGDYFFDQLLSGTIHNFDGCGKRRVAPPATKLHDEEDFLALNLAHKVI